MSSNKNRKHTGQRAKRGANKTERPVQKLEWAKALLSLPPEAFTAVNPDRNGTNPFIQLTGGGSDTVHYVQCGLSALSQLNLADESLSTDSQFGLHLLLQTMANALQAAGPQIKDGNERAKARGIVEYAEGGVS